MEPGPRSQGLGRQRGRGGGGGHWTGGWQDRLTGMGRGRQAAGGGDGREEDEGAGGRHLVQDGREVEVVAAGEEGGRALSPQPWGPARPWPPPSPGEGQETQDRGREGLLTGSGTPLPLFEGTDR